MVKIGLLSASVIVTAGLLAIGCSSTPTDDGGDGVSGARIVQTVKHDESRPLREMVALAKAAHPDNADDPDRASNDPDKPSKDKVPFLIPRHTPNRLLATQGPDPLAQTDIRDLAMPATTLSVDGVGNGFTGPQGAFTVNSAPPDTNGDVGPNHFIQTVNSAFAIFRKDGSVQLGPSPINTLF